MTIRLNKVTRDLNVGLTTVVEFLQKKGFEITANPNTQITEEQYDLLVKEFRKDKNLRIESEKFSQERQNKERNRTSISINDFDETKKESKAKDDVIKTVIPEDARPKFKPVGKIDLDALNRRKKPEPAPIAETPKEEKNITPQSEEQQPAPQPTKQEEKTPVAELKNETVATEPQPTPTLPKEEVPAQETTTEVTENNNVEEKKEEEQKDESIFKIRPTEFVSKINVIGQIDLDALNQSTRPKKKSKEERRKEREEKEKLRQEQKKQMKDAIIKEIRKVDDKASRNEKGEADEDGKKKKKRSRINKEKVDINAVEQQSARSGKGGDKPKDRHGKDRDRNKKTSFAKPEVSDEDVAKQVKETLARLTNKGKTKASKYRKEKRENAINRQQELEDQEMAESKVLKLTEFVTANELANMMNVPVTQVIGTCMSVGIMVSITQRLDAETINLVAEEFGFQTEYVSAEVAQAVVEEKDHKPSWRKKTATKTSCRVPPS